MAPRLRTLLLITGLSIAGAWVLLLEQPARAQGLTSVSQAEEREAVRLYRLGSYEEAAKLFAKLSADYPDNPAFERRVGACFYYLRQTAPALSSLREYLKHKKDIQADDKAEVDRWIYEMEKLQGQTAGPPVAPPVWSPPASAVPMPPVQATPPSSATPFPSVQAMPPSSAPPFPPTGYAISPNPERPAVQTEMPSSFSVAPPAPVANPGPAPAVPVARSEPDRAEASLVGTDHTHENIWGVRFMPILSGAYTLEEFLDDKSYRKGDQDLNFSYAFGAYGEYRFSRYVAVGGDLDFLVMNPKAGISKHDMKMVSVGPSFRLTIPVNAFEIYLRAVGAFSVAFLPSELTERAMIYSDGSSAVGHYHSPAFGWAFKVGPGIMYRTERVGFFVASRIETSTVYSSLPWSKGPVADLTVSPRMFGFEMGVVLLH